MTQGDKPGGVEPYTERRLSVLFADSGTAIKTYDLTKPMIFTRRSDMPEDDNEEYLEMEDKDGRDGPLINEDKAAPKTQAGESVTQGANSGDADAPDTAGTDSAPAETGGGASDGGGSGN